MKRPKIYGYRQTSNRGSNPLRASVGRAAKTEVLPSITPLSLLKRGCTMGKKKIRKDRCDYRGYLKECANRYNSIIHAHPQVRRQLEDERQQREEQKQC